MNKQTLISIVIVVAVVIAGLVILPKQSNKPGQYDELAACIASKGATFYGAFWCPHCAEQKKMFGTSVSKLPYVECSTPDAKGQTPICIEKGIQSYPTWDFMDGSRLTGPQTPATLAEKTGCPMPTDAPVIESTDAGTSAAN